ncbi:hypothetical protein BN903_82 [Halorubrum sp. AJ67]|nr:hypothetical protein BN903_82 [Halorubrum sp. AJ67]
MRVADDPVTPKRRCVNWTRDRAAYRVRGRCHRHTVVTRLTLSSVLYPTGSVYPTSGVLSLRAIAFDCSSVTHD